MRDFLKRMSNFWTRAFLNQNCILYIAKFLFLCSISSTFLYVPPLFNLKNSNIEFKLLSLHSKKGVHIDCNQCASRKRFELIDKTKMAITCIVYSSTWPITKLSVFPKNIESKIVSPFYARDFYHRISTDTETDYCMFGKFLYVI